MLQPEFIHEQSLDYRTWDEGLGGDAYLPAFNWVFPGAAASSASLFDPFSMGCLKTTGALEIVLADGFADGSRRLAKRDRPPVFGLSSGLVAIVVGLIMIVVAEQNQGEKEMLNLGDFSHPIKAKVP